MGVKGQHVIRPKTRGAGIMVSDFINEYNGYLRLSEEEFSATVKKHPQLRRQDHEFLDTERSMKGIGQLKNSLNSLKLHPLLQTSKLWNEGYRVCFVFDHSSCHGTYAEDALDAAKISMEPGGRQLKMHDTYWKGKLQRMVFRDGTPKGLKNILIERGINVCGMRLDDIKKVIAKHSPTFCNEQPEIVHFLRRKDRAFCSCQFHCELNPIEKRAQAKRYLRFLVPDGIGLCEWKTSRTSLGRQEITCLLIWKAKLEEMNWKIK